MNKLGIPALLCVLLLLFLCFMVPDGQILWEAGDAFYTGEALLPPTGSILPYGAGLAASALAAWAFAFLLTKKDVPLCGALRWFACALASGILFSRLLYCIADPAYYNPEWYTRLAALRIWDGGMAMTGALAGILLACRLAPQGAALAPLAAPLFVAGARLSEMFTQVGCGFSVFFEGILARRMGYAVRLNVSLIEAAVAMAIFACMLLLPKWAAAKKLRLTDGSRISAFLLLYGVTQILMESLRKDNHLVWGFTKAQQILALVLVLGALLSMLRDRKRIVRLLLVSLCAAAPVVALEFALDRADVSGWLLYGAYIAILVLFLRSLLRLYISALPAEE